MCWNLNKLIKYIYPKARKIDVFELELCFCHNPGIKYCAKIGFK